MITLFTTGKAFTGHSGVIQRNALESWKRLNADVEVILFGDEEGAAEACAELDMRHEPRVERHESGMKYLPYLFSRAQELARHEYVCYANCDIILLTDFTEALQRVRGKFADFLMIGRRWDTDITAPIEFARAQWERETRELARRSGKQQIVAFIDYFCFRKGLYREIPPLVIGRNYWDHWLVWKALVTPVPVIDCSRAVMAVHQNHDYGYSAAGSTGTHGDELAMRNKQLGGNGENLRSIKNATHVMTRGGRLHRVPYYEQWTTITELGTKQGLLEHSLWLRKRLGLRRQTLAKIRRIIE